MPLRGIKVLEFVGLAPAPFCGRILSDFGASVTRIDKSFSNNLDTLRHGKRTLAVNLKKPEGQSLIRSLSREYDVILEPFRPQVMEKLNIGPEDIFKENPKIIYARLTGFGQTGPLAPRAGHDINYLAVSGILSFLGRKNENPLPPVNLLADFAAGGLLCAFGICLALLERHKSNKGQVVDSAMVDGAAYLASWLLSAQNLPFFGNQRGENVLDTGSFFYETYKTKDGKYMSVGALEPQFYQEFINGLGLPQLEQYSNNEEAKSVVQERFLTKTQSEWSDIFDKLDACVFPVVEWNNAWAHEHNKARQIYSQSNEGIFQVEPAPKLSRSPGRLNKTLENDEDSFEIAVKILKDIGKNRENVKELLNSGVLVMPKPKL